jgi:hypothetical protein
MRRWVIALAFTAGVCAALALVFSQRLPANDQVPGVDVKVTVAPMGELTVPSSGAFLNRENVLPGSPPVSGSVQVTNPSPHALDVTPRIDASVSNLDDEVAVRVTAGTRTLVDGTVASAELGSARSVRLAAGESASIGVQTWLADAPVEEYVGRVVDISLTLESQRSARR